MRTSQIDLRYDINTSYLYMNVNFERTRLRDGSVLLTVGRCGCCRRRCCNTQFPRQLKLHLGDQRVEINLPFLVIARVGGTSRLAVLGCCGVLFDVGA